MQNGKILYRYTVKNGKLHIREGVVNQCGVRLFVNFRDGGSMIRCPRVEDIGRIKSIGHSLWMTERDDNKARKMFIAFESKKIDELNEQINKKLDVIAMLMNVEE